MVQFRLPGIFHLSLPAQELCHLFLILQVGLLLALVLGYSPSILFLLLLLSTGLYFLVSSRLCNCLFHLGLEFLLLFVFLLLLFQELGLRPGQLDLYFSLSLALYRCLVLLGLFLGYSL